MNINRNQKIALWSGVALFSLFAIFAYPQPQVTTGFVLFMQFSSVSIDYHPYVIGLTLIALVTTTAVVTLADKKTRQ